MYEARDDVTPRPMGQLEGRLPFVRLERSPHAPGQGPVEIFYRDRGRGTPIVFLHGGWGYGAYPFDDAITALSDRYRTIAPDRTGFGRSTRIPRLAPDFHGASAEETVLLLDALGIGAAAFWGHSDGAVIAARLAIEWPSRVLALVLEALHFTRRKHRSIAFFREGTRPDEMDPALRESLAREHGEDHWRTVVRSGGEAWLAIIDEGERGGGDLFAGRLSSVRAPVLLLHGGRDPRTEPGELDAVRAALPHAEVHVLDGVGHSPHTSARGRDEATLLATRFLGEALR